MDATGDADDNISVCVDAGRGTDDDAEVSTDVIDTGRAADDDEDNMADDTGSTAETGDEDLE